MHIYINFATLASTFFSPRYSYSDLFIRQSLLIFFLDILTEIPPVLCSSPTHVTHAPHVRMHTHTHILHSHTQTLVLNYRASAVV
jgi:hypothetical protein